MQLCQSIARGTNSKLNTKGELKVKRADSASQRLPHSAIHHFRHAHEILPPAA